MAPRQVVAVRFGEDELEPIRAVSRLHNRPVRTVIRLLAVRAACDLVERAVIDAADEAEREEHQP